MDNAAAAAEQEADAPARPADPENRLHVRPHTGTAYTDVLRSLHETLKPRSYVEVGVAFGATLKLASCATVAVDPKINLAPELMGNKPSLVLKQCTSDAFFRDFDPMPLLGMRHVDMWFLDGMHMYEFLLRDFLNAERFSAPNSVIALHDCLPLDVAMTRRVEQKLPFPTFHKGMWTGDVWKILPTLRKYRPELQIHCLDAKKTGLVLVTGLDPASTVLRDRYHEIVAEFVEMSLADIGVAEFHRQQNVQPAQSYVGFANISRRFWL